MFYKNFLVNNLFMKKIYKLFIIVLFLLISTTYLIGCQPKIVEAKNDNHISNPTISNWIEKDNKYKLNTFINIDFNKISWDNIENIKFFIYFGTRLVGTAESSGANLDNLLMDIPDDGIQVINCDFYKIKKKKEDDNKWIRSYCNIEYPEVANYLKVTVVERKDGKLVRYTTSNNKYKLES